MTHTAFDGGRKIHNAHTYVVREGCWQDSTITVGRPDVYGLRLTASSSESDRFQDRYDSQTMVSDPTAFFGLVLAHISLKFDLHACWHAICVYACAKDMKGLCASSLFQDRLEDGIWVRPFFTAHQTTSLAQLSTMVTGQRRTGLGRDLYSDAMDTVYLELSISRRHVGKIDRTDELQDIP